MNQCDGCNLKLPKDELGIHTYPNGERLVCGRPRYEAETHYCAYARANEQTMAALVKMREERDKALAEVARLSATDSQLKDGLYGVLSTLRDTLKEKNDDLLVVAKRQREACATHLRQKAEEIVNAGGDEGLAIALHRTADMVEEAPLTTSLVDE